MREKFLDLYAQMFTKKKFLRLNNFLFDLSIRGLGILNFKTFEISGEKFFKQFLKKNYSLKTVFDVGANNGNYSGLFQDNCKVYAFEPNPKSFRNLAVRFENVDNVTTLDFGLSDLEGTVKIYDRSDIEGSEHASIFEKVITEIHKEVAHGIDIQLTTLDNFVLKNEIDHISLLKIDTEGNELAVLKGAIKTIKKAQIDIIHIEFNEMNVISKVFLKDFVDLLPEFNFYRLLPNSFLPIDYKSNRSLRYELFAFQNIIAFRKQIDKV